MNQKHEKKKLRENERRFKKHKPTSEIARKMIIVNGVLIFKLNFTIRNRFFYFPFFFSPPFVTIGE